VVGARERLARRAWAKGFVSLALLASLAGLARAEAYSEEVVKALLLERIVTFLAWSQPFSSKAPIRVVVLGDDGFGSELERLFEQKPFAGRSLAVRQVARASEVGNAEIVIIGSEYAGSLPSVLKACGRSGVLTVSDTPGFGEAGVAINFFREGSRVRFELRPSALKLAGIQASYKLLSLARVVGQP
jgi:hypothetical protein